MRIALACLLVVAAAGCKRTLPWKTLEDGFRSEYHVDRVSCPETEVEPGLVFRCELSEHGTPRGSVEIQLVDRAGTFRYGRVD